MDKETLCAIFVVIAIFVLGYVYWYNYIRSSEQFRFRMAVKECRECISSTCEHLKPDVHSTQEDLEKYESCLEKASHDACGSYCEMNEK